MPDTLFTARETYSGDCDDIIQPGLFKNVIEPEAINGPGEYCYILVLAFIYGNNLRNITQIALPYNNAMMKTRYRYDGTWTSWRSV